MTPPATSMSKPRIILGLMNYGPEKSDGSRITSLDEYKQLLDALQAQGYNEVDTARVYASGQQEAFTREAGWQERGLLLATKVQYPSEPGANTATRVRASVEQSLHELGTNTVDILFLHAADRGTPFSETLSEIDKLHKEGKFVRLGLSNYAAFEVAEIVMLAQTNGWVRPTIYQGVYNAITRGLELELLPALRRYHLDLVVYNPLAGGLFSGKIKSKDFVPAEGSFSDQIMTGRIYRGQYCKDSTFQALAIIEEAVGRHEGLTLIETALRWTLYHSALRVAGISGSDGNDGIIIGASSIEQLTLNLAAAEKGPLPDDVVAALDQAWLIAKVDAPKYWHKDLVYTYDTKEALFGRSRV